MFTRDKRSFSWQPSHKSFLYLANGEMEDARRRKVTVASDKILDSEKKVKRNNFEEKLIDFDAGELKKINTSIMK